MLTFIITQRSSWWALWRNYTLMIAITLQKMLMDNDYVLIFTLRYLAMKFKQNW